MRNLLSAVLFVTLASSIACTQVVVLFKPKANIDPIPALSACPQVDEEDPKFKEQWTLEQLGVTAEVLQSPAVLGNANVRIALLSTGVDYNHEDLCGQVAINKKEITQKAAGDRQDVNQIDDDKNGLVDDVV